MGMRSMNKPALLHEDVGPPPEGQRKKKITSLVFTDNSIKAAIARGMANKAMPPTGIVRCIKCFVVQKTPRDDSRRSALGKLAVQGRPGAGGTATISDASPSSGRWWWWRW